jgi:murein DD-endopeptidase MepM/ murein hydrolase activator NlpD
MAPIPASQRLSAPDLKEVSALVAFPRKTAPILASAVTAIAVVAPALAAESSADSADAFRVLEPGAPSALAVREAESARDRVERLAVREKRREARAERRNPGPFVPVVGKVDYGNSANAFGAARYGHVHSGHDMFAPSGTPLVAATDGVVVDAGSDGGQGNFVHIYDPKANRTLIYMHMVAPAKHRVGEKVDAGEEVGGVGCTGSCSGDHLHFEIRAGKSMAGEAQDPLPLLEGWETLEKPL